MPITAGLMSSLTAAGLAAERLSGLAREQLGAYESRYRPTPGSRSPTPSPKTKAERLLRRTVPRKEWLRYLMRGYVLVRGSSGGLYKLTKGKVYGIHQWAPEKAKVCAAPGGVDSLDPADMIAAQYLSLQADEPAFRLVANIRPLSSARRDDRAMPTIYDRALLEGARRYPFDWVARVRNMEPLPDPSRAMMNSALDRLYPRSPELDEPEIRSFDVQQVWLSAEEVQRLFPRPEVGRVTGMRIIENLRAGPPERSKPRKDRPWYHFAGHRPRSKRVW